VSSPIVPLASGAAVTHVYWFPILLFVAVTPLASRASTQRADDNAVTAAADAFGTVVGTQTIGLYSPTNARGFSPTQAGNVRIEGLYFDQQTSGIDPYLFSGSDMRIGIAAQSYAFPAPTGIADLKLRVPTDEAAASIVVNRGPLGQSSAELDTQYPLIQQRLTIGLNVALARDFDYDFALTSRRRAVSFVGRFRPNAGIELIPFLGYIRNTEHRETPLVISDGVHPLPIFDEQRLQTQTWTRWDWNQFTGGIIARIAINGPWSLRAGMFRSAESVQSFMDLLIGLTQNGVADHVVDVSPPHTSSSYSADVRLIRSVSDDFKQGELMFSVRERLVHRHYGGDFISELGQVSINNNADVPQPSAVFSDQKRDDLSQTGIGVNYSERWKDRVSLSFGVLATQYSRRLEDANTPATIGRTTVVSPAMGFTTDFLKPVSLYAGYTRGLEDSVIAPANAVNRGEAPPATPTWQFDGGARIVLPHLQLLIGGFKLHKTYFGPDEGSRYTQLGDIIVRGIESSATLTGPDGLTIVVGGAWLKPEVERRIPKRGGGGTVPVGPVPRTLNINLDYAPTKWRGWATRLQWTSLSARVETADDLHRLPPLTVTNIGFRYRFKLYQRTCSARLDVDNVTNAVGLTISSTYTALPQLRRNYIFTFTADL
jgi:iron complex outermembrane receptor protein